MKRYPNPFRPTPRHSNVCGCGDPAGNFTYCSQSCAKVAYLATLCADCEGEGLVFLDADGDSLGYRAQHEECSTCDGTGEAA